MYEMASHWGSLGLVQLNVEDGSALCSGTTTESQREPVFAFSGHNTLSPWAFPVQVPSIGWIAPGGVSNGEVYGAARELHEVDGRGCSTPKQPNQTFCSGFSQMQ